MISFEIADEVNREQIKDHLRRAEREHLARQAMAAKEKSPVWQSVKGRLSKTLEKWQSSPDASNDEACLVGQS